MLTQAIITTDKVTAVELPTWKRLAFLPKHFGRRNFMRGEALVYRWLSRLSPDYDGGFWRFFQLSNGGFYLAPAKEEPLVLFVEGNGFQGPLSPDAAGIVACLFAIAELATATDDAALADAYQLLRDYAADHPEATRIFAAID